MQLWTFKSGLLHFRNRQPDLNLDLSECRFGFIEIQKIYLSEEGSRSKDNNGSGCGSRSASGSGSA
jgi:hypothetical protein